MVGLGVRLGADARSQLREIHGPAARRYLLPDVLARLEALSLRGVQDEGHAVVLSADDRPNAQPDWLGWVIGIGSHRPSELTKPAARVEKRSRPGSR